MTLFRHILLILGGVFSLWNCALHETAQVLPGNVAINNDSIINQNTEKEFLHAKAVMESVQKRNKTVEDDPDWIGNSYKGFTSQKLNDLPKEKYAEYAEFIDNGTVYVIVHPAYYVFFHSEKPVFQRKANNFDSNIVDFFLRENYDSPVLQLIQEQQKNEKNFIEHITTARKMLILVLPRNYKHHSSYIYGSGIDEYARYLNEITNGSPSIVYLESESATSGKLLTDDLILLITFLEKTGTDSVLVGGGYVGRCQKEFYKYMTNYSLGGTYFIVPEISIFSPSDLSVEKARDLFENKQIDFQVASEFIVDKTSGATNLVHLSSRYVDSVLNCPDEQIDKVTPEEWRDDPEESTGEHTDQN